MSIPRKDPRTDHFLWHLKHRFVGNNDDPARNFDHSHWWANQTCDSLPLLAAVWEVIRRHPNASRVHAMKASKTKCPKSLLGWCIYNFGLKAWPSLNQAERDDLQEGLSELPPQRGFDFRPIHCITLESIDWQRGANPNAVLAVDEALKRRGDPEAKQLRESAMHVRESEIARLAIAHHKAGRIIIAIEPDADIDLAKEALNRALRQAGGAPAQIGRKRIDSWYGVIAEFEKAAFDPKITMGSKLFLEYRNIVGEFSVTF